MMMIQKGRTGRRTLIGGVLAAVCVMTLMGWAPAQARGGPARDAAPAVTQAVTIRNAASGRCLDAALQSIDHRGTKVQLWNCLGATNQVWLLVPVTASGGSSSQAFQIRNAMSGRCLDAELATIGANGTKVQLWDCLGTTSASPRNQSWTRVDVAGGSVQWVNVQSGRVLDAATQSIGVNGTLIQLWNNLNGTNQRWNLVDA